MASTSTWTSATTPTPTVWGPLTSVATSHSQRRAWPLSSVGGSAWDAATVQRLRGYQRRSSALDRTNQIFDRERGTRVLPDRLAFDIDLISVSAGFAEHESDLIGNYQFVEGDFVWATEEARLALRRVDEQRVARLRSGSTHRMNRPRIDRHEEVVVSSLSGR